MNYIGVESIDIAKERVVIRVSKGSHGIPDYAIERRYYDSLNNLLIWRDKKVASGARGIL